MHKLGKGFFPTVVNLAKAVNYGKTTDERFVGMVSVVAHEVFHAAFGNYKDGSPAWRAYYATHRSSLDQLLDLTHNEGIAYYLSLVQSSRGRLPADLATLGHALILAVPFAVLFRSYPYLAQSDRGKPQV